MGPGGDDFKERKVQMETTENKRRKVLIVVLLAIVLGVIIFVQIKPKSSRANAGTDKRDPNLTEKEDQEESGFIGKIPQIAKGYILGDQADEGNTTKGLPRIEASYIIHEDGSSYISIGGKLIREGETINGFKFLKAYHGRVEFEKNGQIFTGTVHDYPKYINSTSNN